ncbi:MAG TPA: metalloregulator ArsR/SmtB family transcription factor [Drouetiella sp.]|jgi:DNA-binding transcriptional ArsR family regulator
MPYRAVVSAELAKLFGVLSHPIRIRIVEELKREDLTVGTLKDILGITHSAVSQQLAVLRSHHLVVEMRQGRNVFYHLRKPELAQWIMEGVNFISPDASEVEKMMSAIQSVKSVWGDEKPAEKKKKRGA